MRFRSVLVDGGSETRVQCEHRTWYYSPGDVLDFTYRLGSEKMRDTQERGPHEGAAKRSLLSGSIDLTSVLKEQGFPWFEMNNCQSEHMFLNIQSTSLESMLGNEIAGIHVF